MFSLVDVALDRRPFIGEKTGHLLLRTDSSLAGHTLSVMAELPAVPGTEGRWAFEDIDGRPIAAGGDVTLPFDLEGLPPSIHNDMTISITIHGHGGVLAHSVLNKTHRFHRVPLPPKGAMVQPVQVDHARQGLLVAGKPWAGVGWYVQSQQGCCGPPACGPHKDDPAFGGHLSNLTDVVRVGMVPRGINVAMVYGIEQHPVAEQLAFLDDVAKDGFKVMYRLDVGNATAQKETIDLLKDHQSILGWYICDDCCSSAAQIAKQAQAYLAVKLLDPYHVRLRTPKH